MEDNNEHTPGELEPNIQLAREAAIMAHNIVIKFKEMGLPESLDSDLASMCTDLGDIWSAQNALGNLLETFFKSPQEWGSVGDQLVDMRACIDHIDWHLKSIRRPMNSLTHYAYRNATEYD